MKDFPSYITLRYYYEDETYSSTYDYSKGSKVIGSILLTEDGQIYLNQQNGCIVNLNSHPDLEEKRCIIPFEWVNNKQIEDCLRRQPYDFEGWLKSDSMYSKNFWRKVLSDIRDFKIKLSLNELKLDETKWIRN
jgi:hypothetical protein